MPGPRAGPVTSLATARRARVLDLRIRLERAAAAAFDEVCQPTEEGRQSNVAARLLYLVDTDRSDAAATHRLVHLGAHVYKRTSDVLHGRVSSLDLPDVLIDEWHEVVVGLEAVVRQRPGAGVISPTP